MSTQCPCLVMSSARLHITSVYNFQFSGFSSKHINNVIYPTVVKICYFGTFDCYSREILQVSLCQAIPNSCLYDLELLICIIYIVDKTDLSICP